MPNQRLSPEILTAALVGLEIEKRKLEERIAEVRAMLGGRSSGQGSAAEATHHRSAAARRKMALAQKARWARVKGEVAAKPAAKKAPAKAKARLSAAGRAAIVAALKKRWAAKKSAAKKAPAGAKKAAPSE
jgi:hypothetical protein